MDSKIKDLIFVFRRLKNLKSEIVEYIKRELFLNAMVRNTIEELKDQTFIEKMFFLQCTDRL